MTRFWAIWVGFGIRGIRRDQYLRKYHAYAHTCARVRTCVRPIYSFWKMVTKRSQQETRPTAPDPQQQKPHELDKKAQLWYTGRMILPTQLLELAKQGKHPTGYVALDTETSGLHIDDNARMSAISIAFVDENNGLTEHIPLGL